MKNKHLTRLLIILIFICLSSTAYVLLPDRPKSEITKPKIQNLPWEDIATNTAISENVIKQTNAAVPQPITTTTDTAPTIEIITNPIQITIEINELQYLLTIPENSTVYDAIQQLVENKKITATMKEFKGMGYFIEEISGQKNNNQTGEYWIYYINNQPAKIGISLYKLKSNDLITWKYEHSKF